MHDEQIPQYNEYLENWRRERNIYYYKVLGKYEDDAPFTGERSYEDMAEDKAFAVFGKEPWDYTRWSSAVSSMYWPPSLKQFRKKAKQADQN